MTVSFDRSGVPMNVGDVMNINPTRILESATIGEAVEILATSQASDLMVVDAGGRFKGVLSEGDLIRSAMPKMDEILSSGGFQGAASLFTEKAEVLVNRPILPIIIPAERAITVSPSDNLIKPAGHMVSMQIRRLPVVQDGQLVGTIARADVCRGALRRA